MMEYTKHAWRAIFGLIFLYMLVTPITSKPSIITIGVPTLLRDSAEGKCGDKVNNLVTEYLTTIKNVPKPVKHPIILNT